MTIHTQRKCHALTQGIKIVETFAEYKVLPKVHLPQNAMRSVEYCDH